MSTTLKPEHTPADLTGSLALEAHLPDPADLPPAGDMPDDADTVANPAALAGRLTGSTDLRAQAAHMIKAGALAEQVQTAVHHTEIYTRVLTDLLTAVDDVIAKRPNGMAKLTYANCRLAWIEQDKESA